MTSPILMVLDLETSIKNRDMSPAEGKKAKAIIGNNKASPFWEDNDVVAMGVAYNEHSPMVFEPDDVAPTSPTLVVGHNIKFDILYLVSRFPSWRNAWDSNLITLWDTQQAEYLLSGQTNMFPSLDQACEKRGLPLKDDVVKDFWAMNIDTEDIPEEILIPYMLADVSNARHVYHDQLKSMSAQQLRHAKVQMEAIVATTEMELNGMQFDKLAALRSAQALTIEVEEIETRLKAAMNLSFPAKEWLPSSSMDVGKYLFGGTIKMREQRPTLDAEGELQYYKSGMKKGEVKMAYTEIPYEIKGIYAEPDPKWVTARGWTVDDAVLKELDLPFTKDILEYRKLAKDIGTYYYGYSSLVWPDGLLHGQMQHCSTVTGRLSSANPNLQNISKEK